jgi:hypothetical protein
LEGLANSLKNIDDKDEIIDDLLNELSKQFLANIEILAKFTQLNEKYYDGSHSRFVAEKSVAIAEQLAKNLGIPFHEAKPIDFCAYVKRLRRECILERTENEN